MLREVTSNKTSSKRYQAEINMAGKGARNNMKFAVLTLLIVDARSLLQGIQLVSDVPMSKAMVHLIILLPRLSSPAPVS